MQTFELDGASAAGFESVQEPVVEYAPAPPPTRGYYPPPPQPADAYVPPPPDPYMPPAPDARKPKFWGRF